MSTLAEIRTGIQEQIPEILRRFRVIIEEEEPWMLLPEGSRVDHFGELTFQLSEVALRPERDEEHIRQMLHTAARHGESRLTHGFPEALVFREHYLLRGALWAHVREEHGRDDPLAFEAIARIDAALSLSGKASIRGFHRPTYEAQGSWPDCIDDLVKDWQTLPPVG